MATNAIGPGTVNLSVNVRKEVRSSLGRAAFRREISMGELCRRLIHKAWRLTAAGAITRRAEKDDLRAAARLRAAMADGIGPEDRGAILAAIADIERSARRDRLVSQSFAA